MHPHEPDGMGKKLARKYTRLSVFLENTFKITSGIKYVLGATGIAGFTGVGILATVPGPIDANELVYNGYHAMQTASTVHGPGVFTTVEDLGDGKLKLHLTCKVDLDALREQWIGSQTALKRKATNRRFIWSKPTPVDHSPPQFDRSRGQLFTLSDEELLTLSKQYLKGSCVEVIQHNLDNGARVCQVKSVIGFPISSPDTASQQTALKSNFVHNSYSGSRHDQLFLGVQLRDRCITAPDLGSEEVLPPSPRVI